MRQEGLQVCRFMNSNAINAVMYSKNWFFPRMRNPTSALHAGQTMLSARCPPFHPVQIASLAEITAFHQHPAVPPVDFREGSCYGRGL